MKVLYSELLQFIPTLKLAPRAVADALGLTGLLVDSFEPVTIAGKKDFAIGLEVRAASRPDCLGVLGVAREVAAYFNLPMRLPKIKLTASRRSLQVGVKAVADIQRICVVEIDSLNNSLPSPLWLTDRLKAHGMNSVSLLVDLSNYAMLMTGFPNHIFDAGKVVGGLVWQRTPASNTFTTLDGTVLELHKGKELVVSDNLGPLVIASSIGGRRSAISPRTTSVLAEVAVYDPYKMRQDSRSLGVNTEASNRLGKDLSAEFAQWALMYLADCLVRFGGGVVSSSIFDYYPKQSRATKTRIPVTLALVERIAGMPVSMAESDRILKRLGFQVARSGESLRVTPPTWRLDVLDAADVAEEIIRIKGFDKIVPALPALQPVPDVTSPRLRVAEKLCGFLVAAGLDEILSLPMTTPELNSSTAWDGTQAVFTQNAINEELPALRQSLASGLLGQQHEYLRKGVMYTHLFEIGKVFGKRGKRYVEKERLGVLIQVPRGQSSVREVQAVIERALRTLGAVRISYNLSDNPPDYANPNAAWLLLVGGKTVGVLYQVKDLALSGNKYVQGTAYAEVDLELLVEQLALERPRSAQELKQKLVVLDANILAENEQKMRDYLSQVNKEIGRSHLWSLEVVDIYVLAKNKTRYTVRVSYQNLSDADAKVIHNKVFVSVPETENTTQAVADLNVAPDVT